MSNKILGLRTTIYKVADIDAAKEWYAKAFETEPYFDEPFYVGFDIAGYELGLQPEENPTTEKAESVATYWGVNEVEVEFNRFIGLGAKAHEEPEEVGGGIIVATVKDPWGNIIGLIHNPHFKELMNQLFPQLNELFEKLKTPITNIESDLECEAYFGCNFLEGTKKIKFRKAKITPKKIGQFVTLWRRNTKGITEPFNAKDEFDFYLIYTEKNEQHGFFLFPRRILADQQILAKDEKDGKRGFRVYPSWDIPENKQAEKTKAWQSEFFIVLGKEDDMKKLISLIGN